MPVKKRLTQEEQQQYLDYLEQLPRYDLTPEEAAPALGCDAYGLTVAAQTGGYGLGSLKYYFTGNRLKIGKMSVLAFCGRFPPQKWNEPKTGNTT